MAKNRALFLDRDGVINIDKTYVSRVEDFEFVEGIFEFLRFCQREGFLLIVVTNQSGIGRGYYTVEDFQTLTAWKIKTLKENGITLDAVFHCPHDPDLGCACRKPAPGMFLQAQDAFDIDMGASWMIGDKPSDIEAAHLAGVRNTILISPDCTDKKGALYCVKSLDEIYKIWDKKKPC